MNTNLRLSIASALFVVGTTTALALPFTSLDPRSMAMGGAGVASTSAATAASFNPAMLAAGQTGKNEEDFALEFPIVGIRLADPEDFADSLDAFQNTAYIDDLSNSLGSMDLATPASFTTVSNDIINLNNDVDGLASLGGKPLNIELGAGAVVSIPGKKFAMALSGTGNIYTAASINYSDADALNALAADMDIAGACAGGDLAACTTIIDGGTTYLTYDDGIDDILYTADDTIVSDFDPATSLTSSVIASGAVITEAGLSFAREFNIAGSDVAIGITPKMTSVSTFYYDTGVATADVDNASDTTTSYSNLNIDIGIAKDFGNRWRAGAVIKNALAQSYDYIDGTNTVVGAIEINPMLRVGVSHQSEWHTLVADLDLTENDPLNGEDGTQYAAIGAEFNAFDFLQLRVGYRADLVNSERSISSVGVGLSPFGLHVDLAVAGNETDVGAAIQLGFRF